MVNKLVEQVVTLEPELIVKALEVKGLQGNQFGRGLQLLGEKYPYSLPDIDLLQAVMPGVGENPLAVDDFFKDLRIIMEQYGLIKQIKPYTLRTFGSHILLPSLDNGTQLLLAERQEMVANIKDPDVRFLASELFKVKVSGYQLISYLERENFNLAYFLLFSHPKQVGVEFLIEQGFLKAGVNLENLKDTIDVGIKKTGSPVRLWRDAGKLGLKIK